MIRASHVRTHHSRGVEAVGALQSNVNTSAGFAWHSGMRLACHARLVAMFVACSSMSALHAPMQHLTGLVILCMTSNLCML